MNEPQTPEEEKEDILKFPYREAVGALMWTDRMTRLDIACAVCTTDRLWNPGFGALLQYDDVGHTLPASHERVGYHIR